MNVKIRERENFDVGKEHIDAIRTLTRKSDDIRRAAPESRSTTGPSDSAKQLIKEIAKKTQIVVVSVVITIMIIMNPRKHTNTQPTPFFFSFRAGSKKKTQGAHESRRVTFLQVKCCHFLIVGEGLDRGIA